MLERVKGAMAGRLAASFTGPAKRAHGEAEAERLLGLGCQRLGIVEVSLANQPKGQLEKQVLAWWLCAHTTVTRRWVSERLRMGHESRIGQAQRYIRGTQDKKIIQMKSKLSKITA